MDFQQAFNFISPYISLSQAFSPSLTQQLSHSLSLLFARRFRCNFISGFNGLASFNIFSCYNFFVENYFFAKNNFVRKWPIV